MRKVALLLIIALLCMPSIGYAKIEDSDILDYCKDLLGTPVVGSDTDEAYSIPHCIIIYNGNESGQSMFGLSYNYHTSIWMADDELLLPLYKLVMANYPDAVYVLTIGGFEDIVPGTEKKSIDLVSQ